MTAAGSSQVVTRAGERSRIVASFGVFGLSNQQRGWILEALDSTAWDWFTDCDGCTRVSEVYWPTKYFPPCLRHDFDCARGDGGWDGSGRFYELQRAYGMPRWRAGVRAAVVTVNWYALGWWRSRHPQ
jgi:hypothetical protein